MRKIKMVSVVFILLFLSPAVYPKSVRIIKLENGNEIQGIIVQGAGPVVKVDVGAGIIGIDRDQIYQIIKPEEGTQKSILARIEKQRQSQKQIAAMKEQLGTKVLLTDIKKTYEQELTNIYRVTNFQTKILEKHDQWWKWAWNIDIRNNKDKPLFFIIKLQFIDKNNFVLLEKEYWDNLYPYIEPNGTKTFVNYVYTDPIISDKVYRINAEIKLAQ